MHDSLKCVKAKRSKTAGECLQRDGSDLHYYTMSYEKIREIEVEINEDKLMTIHPMIHLEGAASSVS